MITFDKMLIFLEFVRVFLLLLLMLGCMDHIIKRRKFSKVFTDWPIVISLAIFVFMAYTLEIHPAICLFVLLVVQFLLTIIFDLIEIMHSERND